ncbi:phenylalanine--tRNA ligase subunit beta [Candidatus Woesearchaeota archaeon]|jgi:phenylalanyl-tRNA synthetase beta chain|nr:phenylalanine--tRNA ligase subunit beta [Candidatus Woesearchaeota archaeon]MBT5397312.1 phenylalanine--tRNA ligase subunit beta [Candidatus Woesearchaeota archaeon]MBT5924793.1 phenylalanine--tRNA ligase subunit beta [Candidatus Woesearchaeota archaeon]MBT6367843.1 phenylalanine--tRNA ligase subunit beta [Candidatus Woesearchaeota archaeon]MBT7762712.1 phenylalanine--tRNA ligase subunit beta [Candidatus Woesearchaeota archaeon]
MPTVTLNKTVFEELVGKKLPLDELKDRISMLGTDLERIEGDEIEVEIFPNRPDMLSEQGFARAFSSFIGVKKGLREYVVKESDYNVIIENSVSNVRPYTACAIIKGIQFDDEKIKEIIQIQEKMHVTFGRNRKKAAIGLYPLNKITFPVTYKAEDPTKFKFIPLESNNEMTGLQILSQHKTGQEFGHLLEGKEKYPYFIDANKQILSMPPIINSDTVGKITRDTKDVFIECSGFQYDVLHKCLSIIVTALADMGGEIYSVTLSYGKETKTSPDLTPQKMTFDLKYINKRLGLDLQEKDAIELLSKMGFGYDNGNVLIPMYRNDILHQVDLAEDIAIAYGYENFKEEIPNVATIGEELPIKKFARKVREILTGLKMVEVKNYHLMTVDDLNTKMNLENPLIPLQNALGEHNHLRNAILPSLIKNIRENQHNEFPQNIFEIGRVFTKDPNTETTISEKDHLAMVLCHEKTDFTESKQVLDALLTSLGMKYSIQETQHTSYIPGRVGNIIVNEKSIGIIGELSPDVITRWGIQVPIVVFELDLEKLI